MKITLLISVILLTFTQITLATEYKRSDFGSGWADFDKDCQNSRAEILIIFSTNPVTFGDNPCIVATGKWISVFTNDIISNASKMDIDHVVPLKWAWDHGADKWTREKRIDFANANINLIPVEAKLNRSKGAKGIQDWLPPMNKCAYILRFTRVLSVYDLPVSRKDVKLRKKFCHR